MKLLEKILVPIDIEKVSNDQLEVAVKLADSFNSKIILLSVLPEEAKQDSIKNYIESFTKAELNKLIDFMSYPEDKISTILEYGNRFNKIISVSESENVNLIIHVNHSSGSDEKVLIDVLSEKLVRKSSKPVMIVKPGVNIVPKTILCPIDYSDSSERALKNAVKIARVFNSTLFIINVYEPIEESFSGRLNIDFNEENKKQESLNKQQFEDFISKFNFTELNYKTNILTGNPESVIKEFIAKNSIDLVFIGATGKTFIQRLLLGSVVESILRDLPASMIVTKAENLLDLKIEADISSLEKHFNQAKKLEDLGYYNEAIEQLKVCLQINDLHIPVLRRLSNLYLKLGENELSENYMNKSHEILRRIWDKKIEFEIRKGKGKGI